MRVTKIISLMDQTCCLKNSLSQFAMCFACTISFNPDNNLMEGYYYPHFMDGGTETQRHNFPRATL